MYIHILCLNICVRTSVNAPSVRAPGELFGFSQLGSHVGMEVSVK